MLFVDSIYVWKKGNRISFECYSFRRKYEVIVPLELLFIKDQFNFTLQKKGVLRYIQRRYILYSTFLTTKTPIFTKIPLSQDPNSKKSFFFSLHENNTAIHTLVQSQQTLKWVVIFMFLWMASLFGKMSRWINDDIDLSHVGEPRTRTVAWHFRGWGFIERLLILGIARYGSFVKMRDALW